MTPWVDAAEPEESTVIDVVRQQVRWGLGHALPRTVVRASAARGDLHGRLILAGIEADPTAVFTVIEQIREQGPLHRSRLGFVTTSLPTVKEVLSSNDFRTGFPADGNGVLLKIARWAENPDLLGPLIPPSLLVSEPPDHTRYRRLVTRVFTVRAVEGLRTRAEEIAHGLLDEIEASHDGGTVDLVATYAALLPVTMIAEILGVPLEERHRVLDFGSAAAPSLDLGLPYRRFRSVERALSEFDQWLGQHLDSLRAHPGDDLLSQLVAAQDDGVGLTQAELKATAGLVLAAGFETTVNLLGNGTALLAAHPEQLAALRSDPTLWANAVDEALRVDPPVLLTGRIAATDTEVGGQPVAKGEFITTVLAGANRDPDVFADPTHFDVTRANARDHVAFSAGRHYCLGAALARMEGEVGLTVLFDRYPDLVVLPDAPRRVTRILRGYERLPVRLAG